MTDPQTEVTVLDLCDLIDWLALTYGENDPIWPLVHPTTGEPMEHNERLNRTWQVVVRHKSLSEVPSSREGADNGKDN